MSDYSHLDDDQLDQERRNILTEQERRAKIERGLGMIGQVVRDYLEAAGLECPDLPNVELGQHIISLL